MKSFKCYIPSFMNRFSLIVCVLAVLAISSFSVTAQTWEQLTQCKLMKDAYADGDSFHVKHQGKEYVFRLYFVDTPEPFKRGGYHKRTDAQAKYYNIYKRDLYTIAADATAFTAQALEDRFTVWTIWQDAKGQSRLPRYFGIVITDSGEDLGELLVQRGLARIYGAKPESNPPFQTTRRMLKDLEKAEAQAKEAKVGAWAYSKK